MCVVLYGRAIMLRWSLVVVRVIRSGNCSLSSSVWKYSVRQSSVTTLTSQKKVVVNQKRLNNILGFMERDVSSSIEVGVVKEAPGNENSASAEVSTMEETENSCSEEKKDPESNEKTGAEKYGYLDRGYSTEMFKIELSNINHHMGYKKIREFLQSLDLNPGKIKKPISRLGVVFVNFKDEPDRKKAIEVLNGTKWKNRVLKAKTAFPAADPLFLAKKRKLEAEGDSATDPKKIKTMTPEQRLFEAVCPWADIPYKEQLKKKEDDMKTALRRMSSILSGELVSPVTFTSSVGTWIEESRLENDGVFCPVETIKPSPMLEQYRNKCEYTVGYGDEAPLVKEEEGTVGEQPGESSQEEQQSVEEEGEKKRKREKVVGFRTGSYEQGDFGVVSPENCPHLPDRMKELSKLLQIFFNESPLEPYLSANDEGYWRGYGIRCYNSGDSMVTVQMHPQKFSQEDIEKVKEDLIKFFTSGGGSKAPPTSLYFQLQGRKRSNETVEYQHLLGEKYVHEDLLGMKYRIGPPSFFQVNTAGCGVLYNVIKEAVESDPGKKPAILDLCCGTGTIGLYLSKVADVNKVVGIEIVPEAVEDAKQNALLNGVTNADFVCGRVERVIKDLLLMQHVHHNIIGILDPPRGGVHQDVILAIRKCSAIKKLIFVACKPHAYGVQHNIINLCKGRTNNVKGEPFRPVKAIPVDLFPHTPHCELVIVLERTSQNAVKAPESKPKLSKLEPEQRPQPEHEAEPEPEPEPRTELEPKLESET